MSRDHKTYKAQLDLSLSVILINYTNTSDIYTEVSPPIRDTDAPDVESRPSRVVTPLRKGYQKDILINRA